MLSKIYIHNFALIDEVEFRLEDGLQVITGETGAGKSILLGALRLIMGERFDANSVGDSSKKSIVEAYFNLEKGKHEKFFEKNDLDFSTETIVRREISAAGKSRAFINDTPVTLNILKDLTKDLVDIHSQFETSNLFSEAYQLNILDNIAKQNEIINAYRKEFQNYTTAKKRLEDNKEALGNLNKEADYQQFLLNELQEIDLEKIDLEALKAELSTQENAESITRELSEGIDLLQMEEVGIVDHLAVLTMKLQQVSKFHPKYNELVERLQSAHIELKDISAELEVELENVNVDPAYAVELNQRLNKIYSLLTKHQVQSIEELIQIRDAILTRDSEVESLKSEIEILSNKVKKHRETLDAKVQEISRNRKIAASDFVTRAKKVLKRLGLENAALQFVLTESDSLHDNGKDNVQLMFQANAGYELKPIQSAASGGERARVMFAVKKVVAENGSLPTLILDEIDTGISGRVAEEMGKLMKEMGTKIQLIVITHLAQIAAKGNRNYKVSKTEIEGRTQTFITQLNEDERLLEIAQLISGTTVTQAAIAQAKELMN